MGVGWEVGIWPFLRHVALSASHVKSLSRKKWTFNEQAVFSGKVKESWLILSFSKKCLKSSQSLNVFFSFSDFDAQKKDLPCGRSNSIPFDWKLTEDTSEFYWTLCVAVDYFKNWQKKPQNRNPKLRWNQ